MLTRCFNAFHNDTCFDSPVKETLVEFLEKIRNNTSQPKIFKKHKICIRFGSQLIFNDLAGPAEGGVHRVHVHPQFFEMKDHKNLYKFSLEMASLKS